MVGGRHDVIFHTSYLSHYRNGLTVAIKFISADARSNEVGILERLQAVPSQHPARRHLPRLLNHFEHKGPNGTHYCLVLEVLGESVGMFALFPRSQLPQVLAKSFSSQFLSLLDFMHNVCGFVHTGNAAFIHLAR
jgi:serine/threonine protein kinase